MSGFIEGLNRSQSTLFPEKLDDYIEEDNPVRVVDVFIDELNLTELGFVRANPKWFYLSDHVGGGCLLRR